MLSTDFELDVLYKQLSNGINNFADNVIFVRNAKRAINQVSYIYFKLKKTKIYIYEILDSLQLYYGIV